jgi:2-haloacid dehalogenase
MNGIKALGFDVFGTVVDWRTSITREGEAFGRAHKLDVDWLKFAVAWRGLYQPMMNKVRNGEIGWTKLDDLHRMALDQLMAEFGIKGLAEKDIDHLNRAWHRLDPWPDSVPGLTRLKTKYVLTPLSNGNIALMVNMAKRAGLPWDAILGAEPAQHYKPHPEAYLRTAGFLGIPPEELMLVAAHNGDLKAARSCGLKTAFVPRPMEHGPGQTKDLTPEADWDVVASDFVDLAKKMGC